MSKTTQEYLKRQENKHRVILTTDTIEFLINLCKDAMQSDHDCPIQARDYDSHCHYCHMAYEAIDELNKIVTV